MKKIIYILLSVLLVILMVLFLYELNTNTQKLPEVSGNFFIYVESLPESIKHIKLETAKIDGTYTQENNFPQQYTAELSVKIPFSQRDQFIEILHNEANDKIVYGLKSIFPLEKTSKSQKNIEIRITLIDVKALED